MSQIHLFVTETSFVEPTKDRPSLLHLRFCLDSLTIKASGLHCLRL